MKTGLGNWSRKFFPRLHREGLNSNEKEKKKIKKKGKRRKKEEKRAKIYIVIKFECETASRGMFIRKKKKGERKKRGKVLQRNEDETSKVPFSVAFCLKALFSLVPRKTRTSVSLLVGKARFYHTWRDRREKKRRYPRFKRDSWKFHPRGNGSSKPDPTCCAMIFFFHGKRFPSCKISLILFRMNKFRSFLEDLSNFLSKRQLIR